jgi:hypothetical protein
VALSDRTASKTRDCVLSAWDKEIARLYGIRMQLASKEEAGLCIVTFEKQSPVQKYPNSASLARVLDRFEVL